MQYLIQFEEYQLAQIIAEADRALETEPMSLVSTVMREIVEHLKLEVYNIGFGKGFDELYPENEFDDEQDEVVA